GPARISRNAAGLRSRHAPRQMEDDDPALRHWFPACRTGRGQDLPADDPYGYRIVVDFRPGDALYGLRLFPRRSEARNRELRDATSVFFLDSRTYRQGSRG